MLKMYQTPNSQCGAPAARRVPPRRGTARSREGISPRTCSSGGSLSPARPGGGCARPGAGGSRAALERFRERHGSAVSAGLWGRLGQEPRGPLGTFSARASGRSGLQPRGTRAKALARPARHGERVPGTRCRFDVRSVCPDLT